VSACEKCPKNVNGICVIDSGSECTPFEKPWTSDTPTVPAYQYNEFEDVIMLGRREPATIEDLLYVDAWREVCLRRLIRSV
jgi:hypothetical protein